MRLLNFFSLLSTVSACIYPRQTTTHWTYEGAHGPAVWHTLSPEFELCANGKYQSPINILSTSPTTSIQLSYPSTGTFTLTNNGHAIEADAVGNYTATLGDNTYVLKNIHFHLPAEHHVDGKAYPLETHFVHSDAAGKLAVVGVFFDIHAVKSTQLLRDLPLEKVTEEGSVTGEVGLSLRALVKHVHSQKIFNYSGSLTTPPCTEGVSWFVVEQPMPISLKGYDKLRDATRRYNARFTQNEPGEVNLLRKGEEL